MASLRSVHAAFALAVVIATIMLSASTTSVHAESSMQSRLAGGWGEAKLDPSVQHIPLSPHQAHLRPPPARVPTDPDFFVGLSVFRDGYRCAITVFTGFKRATHPDRIHFGIIDQVNPGDAKCIDEYCKMAHAEWPEHGACRYRDQIRIDERLADDSRGPTLARHYQQKLVRDQEFCLQLDGHSVFTNGWDANLVSEFRRIDNEMAVLTTYLHHIHDFVKPNGDNNVPHSLPHLCTTIRGGNGLVRNEGASMITGSKFPQLTALWGAGLSFSKCHAERRVLIDSHTLWMFDGEEFLRSSHLWTHGYDLYSPSPLGSVVYHNYSSVPARFENVRVNHREKERESEMGRNRFKLIVGKPFKGLVDTHEMDKYAFGNVRSFQQYLDFSGVTFVPGKNDTNTCRQLHWVPYADPTEVEAIVGGGWTMHPKKTVRKESASVGPDQPAMDDDEGRVPVKAEMANNNKAAGRGVPNGIDPDASRLNGGALLYVALFVAVAVVVVRNTTHAKPSTLIK